MRKFKDYFSPLPKDISPITEKEISALENLLQIYGVPKKGTYSQYLYLNVLIMSRNIKTPTVDEGIKFSVRKITKRDIGKIYGARVKSTSKIGIKLNGLYIKLLRLLNTIKAKNRAIKAFNQVA